MIPIIVVLPKAEEAARMKSILKKSGYPEVFACSSGARAVGLMNELDGGIVISGCRMADMTYLDIAQDMPAGYQMLLLVSRSVLPERGEQTILCLAMPFKVHELIQTLEMMTRNLVRRRKKQRSGPKERSEEERGMIRQAKALLMERNRMTEEEAHRYLQKCSMDSGTDLAETAQMVLAMMK